MFSKIRSIEYYLPKNKLTNNELEKRFPDWNSKKVEEKVGIRNRCIASENETALDLALLAGNKILRNFEREKIDLLILCTQSPEYYLPSGACILQNKLGLRTDIGAFDINLGCSGYIYGLACSKSFLNTGIAQSVLFITAETYSKYIHPKDKNNLTIFGDGAAATIIEKSDTNGILQFSLGTDGLGYHDLIIPNGGLRHRFDRSAEEINDNGSIRSNNNLYMNGPEIFNFSIERVPKLIDNVLLANKMTLQDIEYVIFHQANKYILTYLKEKIKIPSEKFCIDMTDTGNTTSSTIPIALKNAIQKRIIKSGDKVLLAGFGVGYSWGGTIITV